MTRRQLIEQVRGLPAFARAREEAVEQLLAAADVVGLGERQVLFERGAPADRVFVVLEGVIRVYQAFDDREVTITHLTAGNTFGEMEVISEGRGGTVRGFLESTMSMVSATVLGIPAADFVAFLDADAGCSRELLGDICSRFCDSATRELAIFLEVPARLASLLLAYADLAGKPVDGGIQIKLKLSQDDLAAGLGVTTKSIARALKQWKTSDWVVRHKGWLLIKNADALEELCHGARFKLTR